MLATSREPQNWEHQHVWQRFERLDKKVLLLTCHDFFSPSKTLSSIETYWTIEASPFRNATKLVWAIHVRFWTCMIETWFPETFVPSFRLCTAFGKASRVALCCRVLAWPMAALTSPMTISKGLGGKHLIEVRSQGLCWRMMMDGKWCEVATSDTVNWQWLDMGSAVHLFRESGTGLLHHFFDEDHRGTWIHVSIAQASVCIFRCFQSTHSK